MKITREMLDRGYVEIDRYDLKSWKVAAHKDTIKLGNNLYLALAALLIAALIVCMIKKGYRIYAIISFAYAILDIRFALVGVLNIVMYFLMYREEKILSEMPGFPNFETLRIVTVDNKKEVDKIDYYEYPKNM